MAAVNVHNILRKSLLSGFIAGTQPEKNTQKNNRGKDLRVGRVGRLVQNTLHIWVMFYDHEERFTCTETPESSS